MKEPKLVSVVTIFLNAEQFLREAIESVISQTYSHWELLLVDDGSSDGSTGIAKEFESRNPEKVRYLEHEGHRNRGMSASRNLGIRSARGALIALLDSDDVWLPQKLEKHIAILEQFPEAGIIFGKSTYWSGWTGRPKDLKKDFVPGFRIRTNTLYRPPELLLSLYPLGTGGAPCPSGLIFRKDRALVVGGFEEQFTGMYSLYEDQAFLVKMYLHDPVFFAEGVLEKYRIHKDSCVSRVTASGQYPEVRLYFLNWLQEYFDGQRLQNHEIRDALKQALFRHNHPVLSRILRLTKLPVR